MIYDFWEKIPRVEYNILRKRTRQNERTLLNLTKSKTWMYHCLWQNYYEFQWSKLNTIQFSGCFPLFIQCSVEFIVGRLLSSQKCLIQLSDNIGKLFISEITESKKTEVLHDNEKVNLKMNKSLTFKSVGIDFIEWGLCIRFASIPIDAMNADAASNIFFTHSVFMA